MIASLTNPRKLKSKIISKVYLLTMMLQFLMHCLSEESGIRTHILKSMYVINKIP